MVSAGELRNPLLAKYISDILVGGVVAVEKYGGLVVGFAGDQFLALFENVEDVFRATIAIAKDLDEVCEFIDGIDIFELYGSGIKMKIGIEFGVIDVAGITTKFLGPQKLFVGSAINYASRIMAGGQGNRCNVGPKAYRQGLFQYTDSAILSVGGKAGESPYTYYNLDLDDVWRNDKDESYWG